MEERLIDRGAEGGNGERRNVKASALEVILAGNLSYHSDLVKALQQPRGKREREREQRSFKALHGCLLNGLCVDGGSLASRLERYLILMIDRVHFVSSMGEVRFSLLFPLIHY